MTQDEAVLELARRLAHDCQVDADGDVKIDERGLFVTARSALQDFARYILAHEARPTCGTCRWWKRSVPYPGENGWCVNNGPMYNEFAPKDWGCVDHQPAEEK